MWRQRQGGLSLTRSLSLQELALNHGLTQLQHHQTLQCLWADFQAVFELWNVFLLPGHFQTFLFSSLQIAQGGSTSCGVGIPWNIDCVFFLQHLDITPCSQLVFPWNSKFLPLLQGDLGGFSFISLLWLSNDICWCWFLVVLDTVSSPPALLSSYNKYLMWYKYLFW